MKNVRLDFSDDRLLRTAEKLVDGGKHLSALKILNKNCAMNGDTAYSHLLYAQIFDDMGLFESSINEWFKFLAASEFPSDDDLCDAYEGLAVGYMNVGNDRFSAFYYNKLLQNSYDVDEGMKAEIMQNFLGNEESPLKFVYPPEIADCSDIIADGVGLMKEGEFDKAIKQFAKVDERNPSYVVARNYMAMSYIISDRLDEAERVCHGVLEKRRDDVHALTTLAAVKTEQNKKEESKELAKRLIKLKLQSPDDMFKIATVCCENGMHAEAFALLSELTEKLPYDFSILYFKAISAFNSGNTEQCFKAFDTMLTINPNAVIAKYYYEAARIAAAKGDKTPMSYFYRMPPKERESSLKILAALSSLTHTQARKAVQQVDVTDCVRWCFDEGEGAPNSELRYLGAVCALKCGLDDIVSDVLLDAFSDDELKIKILSIIGARNEERDVHVVICNVLKRVSFRHLNLGRTKRKAFLEAYAMLTSHFALLDENLSDKFADFTERMYQRFEAEGALQSVKDINLLAAAIFLSTKVKLPRMSRRSDICKYFEVDGESLSDIYGV